MTITGIEPFAIQANGRGYDGHLLAPTCPGLGIELDREPLRLMPPAVPTASRHLRRENTNYSNW